MRILNRIVRWKTAASAGGECIEWEADPRHTEIIIKQMGLTFSSKCVATPGVKVKPSSESERPLSSDETTLFRSVCMRANFLALDRPEIQYASKEIARSMSNPTRGAFDALKRLARFLVGHPRTVWRYPRQSPCRYLDNHSDSDWAGCLSTRKSTSALVTMIGNHCIKTSSSTQSVLALSSGEAEWYSLVKSASHGLGFIGLARDLGLDLQLRLWTDSSAAKGIGSRRGIGKIRHLETSSLWLQRAVTDRRLTLHKDKGETNQSDVGTKHLDAKRIWYLLGRMNLHPASGVSNLAYRAAL